MKEYFGSFNYRRDDGKPTYDPPGLEKTQSCPLTVDGHEVSGAWYGDTTEGIVKAYLDESLVANSVPHIFKETQTLSLPSDIEAIKVADDCYLLSRTIRGHVQIWGDE